MIHMMPCRNPCRLLHPSCIHILRWSLKRSVKRTWTSSAFSTNESAWSVMVSHGLSISCVMCPSQLVLPLQFSYQRALHPTSGPLWDVVPSTLDGRLMLRGPAPARLPGPRLEPPSPWALARFHSSPHTNVPGGFWKQSVETLVFPTPTSYFLACFGFSWTY